MAVHTDIVGALSTTGGEGPEIIRCNDVDVVVGKLGLEVIAVVAASVVPQTAGVR